MTLPWHDGSDIAFVPAELAAQGVTYAEYESDAGDFINEQVIEPVLSDEEIERLLAGDLTPLGLTAAMGQQEHTGAMIALLPSQADMDRLYVLGGEEDDELHVTLAYLGEAAKIPPMTRDRIVESVMRYAHEVPVVDADGFSVAVFNEQNMDKETCVALLVSGEELSSAKKKLLRDLEDIMYDAPSGMPEQHSPWIPHITLVYTDSTEIAQSLSDREGPIRFDRVRVAFAGEVTDFPLYDGTASSETAEENPVEEYEDDVVQAAGAKESDVNRKGGSHNLLHYWTRGPGALKVGWGTDGSMQRCIALLKEKGLRSPGGLCAEYHHAATGEWPTEHGKAGIPSAVEIEALEAELVTAMVATGDVIDLDAELGEYDGGWEGPLVMEDTDTGDGRMFSGGSLTWGDTKDIIHSFQWAPANNGEHKGSVTAGRIDKIWRSPDNPRIIMGKGRFNLNDPDGLRAFRQVRDGFAGGVSIDPDQIADADVELEFDTTFEDGSIEQMTAKPTKTIFHAGRIRGATLVAFPALVEASIRLTKKSDTPAVTASLAQWRAVEHELRLGDEIEGLTASMAFAHVMHMDDFIPRSSCRFLHHEIAEDGSVGLPSLTACAQHIAAINAGRTFGLTSDELFAAYQHMAQHFTEAGTDAPAFELETEAAGIVASVPATPPLEWFGDPRLTGPTPVTVTDDGRVFGHAATWGTCHTGFADACVTPPMENDYAYFTTGEVLTAEGHRVAVGQITLGTSHAPTHGVTLAKAIDHYGDTGTAVADVTAGTDDHGIWIAGSVRPSVTSDQLHALRASALSGDWRRIGGQLRMVALLAVNVPGFPIPRVSTALNTGKQVSLVAAGVVDREHMDFTSEITLLAGSCGIPLGKKKKMYATMDEELAALAAEITEG